MSGGKRKLRKPQKWEDFVADKEQLDKIDRELKEMENEKKFQCKMMIQEELAMKVKEEEGNGRVKSEQEAGEVTTDLTKGGQAIQEEVKHEEMELEEECMKGDTGQGSVEEQVMKEAEVVAETEGEGQEQLLPQLKVAVSVVVAEGGEDVPVSPRLVQDISGECTSCGIQLRDWTTIYNHLKFHRLAHMPDCVHAEASYKKFSCVCCERTCQSREVLAYHAFTEHFSPTSLTCPFCGQVFTHYHQFRTHLDFDFIRFKCNVCGQEVDREHRFYQHVSQCITNNYASLVHVPCPICQEPESVPELHEHLVGHSTLLSLRQQFLDDKLNKRPFSRPAISDQTSRPRLPQSLHPFLCEVCDHIFVVYRELQRHLHSHTKSHIYLCQHCHKSFCRKMSLIVHLRSYHNVSPLLHEVSRKKRTAQRCCKLCNQSGFMTEALLVRHCLLRCPHRSPAQRSFAAIITKISNEKNLSFVEVVGSQDLKRHLRRGLQAWATQPPVQEFLEKQRGPKEVAKTEGRIDHIDLTDVQLLASLDRYEQQQGHHRSPKVPSDQEGGGSVGSSPHQTQPDVGASDASSHTPPPPSTKHTPDTSPRLNVAALMHHLRGTTTNRGSSKKEESEARPVDICFVTSTTNTQVTITPAGHLPSHTRPPKVARSLPHKPSVREIQARYPGVRVLGDVDFTRIPSLLLEMRQLWTNSVGPERREPGVSLKHLQRLEVEAQFLREAEPFYLASDPAWQLGTEGGQGHNGASTPLPHPDMCAQVREVCSQTLCSPSSPQASPSKELLTRLLNEAREIVS